MFFAVLSKIKNEKFSIMLSVLFAFIITMEILSFYLSGNLIDYRFYAHFDIEILKEQISMFLHLILFFSGLFMALALILYKISRMFIIKTKFAIIFCSICVAFLSFPKGIFYEFVDLSRIVFAKENNFKNSLKDLNISDKQYVGLQNLEVVGGGGKEYNNHLLGVCGVWIFKSSFW